MEFDISYFSNLLSKGFSKKLAWILAINNISNSAKLGVWYNSELVKDVTSTFRTESSSLLCELRGTITEVNNILYKARMFLWKPDGVTTLLKLSSKHSLPMKMIQDPCNYDGIIGFLAPGPLGNCYSLPNDIIINKELEKIAINLDYFHNQNNLKI
jgi:hypothetical protein